MRPFVNGKLMTPDEAMAKGLCPECGDDLRVSNPIAHRKSHWAVDPPRNARGNEARRRMAMFDKFIVDNKVTTSNQKKPDAPAAEEKAKPADVVA